MRTVYLDASGAAKLVVEEAESQALSTWLSDRPLLASSALLRTELTRAVRRREPGLVTRARELLLRIGLREIDSDVLGIAAALSPVSVRTLDAIHLATALGLAAELTALVTYDRRMIEAAALLGLPVASPATDSE